MAKRTYNRRGRQTAKTPVRNDGRGRVQRQKAAQVARDTGSKDRVTRGRGVSRTATGAPRGAQGPANPPVQGPSRRTPTAIGGDTGRRIPENKYGTKGTPKSGPKTPGTMLRGANTVRNVGLLINPRSDMPARLMAGAQLLGDAYGAIRGSQQKTQPAKRGMSNMGSDYKAQERKLSRAAGASNFDAAFAKARREGKKTFTWRGKSYNTRMK